MKRTTKRDSLRQAEKDIARQHQDECDRVLGAAVRAIVEEWLVPGMTTDTMPIDYLDGRHEVTKAIVSELRKERDDV